MANIQTDGVITRTELALSNLAFTPVNGYYIQRNGFGPGEVGNRSTFVESPYVIGKIQTHVVKDLQTSTLTIRVEGDDQEDLFDKMTELCEAFEQFNYTLTIIINGTTFTYSCYTADYAVGEGGQLDDLMLRSNMQMITFDIPHQPKQSGFY